MNEIDYSKLKQNFETEKEAIEFLKNYVNSLSLEYVPAEVAKDIREDTIAKIGFDLILGEIFLYTADIRIAVQKCAGQLLLKYNEYKAKEKK